MLYNIKYLMLAMLSKEPARKYELKNENRFVISASDS